MVLEEKYEKGREVMKVLQKLLMYCRPCGIEPEENFDVRCEFKYKGGKNVQLDWLHI